MTYDMDLESGDTRGRRERYLIGDLIGSAKAIRDGFESWTTGEIQELALAMDTLELEPATPDLLLPKIKHARQRLRDIEQHELPSAIRECREKEQEIYDGAYSNALEATDYLKSGIARIEGIAREVLRMRDMTDAFAD